MITDTEEGVFTPPQESRASRKMPKRSRASCRGLAAINGRKYVFESMAEFRTLALSILRPDIEDVWDQPPAVTYLNARGQIKSHTFDFMLKTRAGEQIAVAVKSYARAVSSNFREELELIGQQLPEGYADEIVLITERDLSKTAATSATRCLHSTRLTDPEADNAISSVVSSSAFPTTIERLVEASGLFGRGYRALLRAIADGRLVVTNNASIDYGSTVVRGPV
ncbi:MAG: hypothetical protein ABJO09_11665 [Hyphomicrobiales bacterium]